MPSVPVAAACCVLFLGVPLGAQLEGRAAYSGGVIDGSVPVPPDSPAMNLDQADIEFQVDIMLGLVPAEEASEYWRAQQLEREQDMVRCMDEAGFRHEPIDYLGNFEQQMTVEWAEQWGFGLFTMITPEGQQESTIDDPNREYMDSLTVSERDAYFAVFDRCVSIRTSAVDQIWMNSDLQEAMSALQHDIEFDPRMAEAREAWAGCMTEEGFAYASREEVSSEWQSGSQWPERQRFQEAEAWKETSPEHEDWQRQVDLEIATAVAVARCDDLVDAAREEVSKDLRAEAIDLWASIDWEAPAATEPEGPWTS